MEQFKCRASAGGKLAPNPKKKDFLLAQTTISYLHELPFALKNSKRIEDDFFTGEPDLIVGDTVLDIKNSWDCWTFPLFDTEIPTDDYYYQLQIYMHITGLKKAKLVYVLLDTPETKYEMAISYDHVPNDKRIKVFDLEYDEKTIEMLKDKVLKCREYLSTILK